MTAESLPPIRTWNGEKYVDRAAARVRQAGVGFVYWNVRGDGTAVIVNVPL